MGLPRRTAGFTLIELMIVAAIMSIILLAFRASFSKSIANKHSMAAAMELVRLGRRARSEAMGLQRAHLVYIDPDAGALRFGVASLLRGNSTHCDLEPWATFHALCTRASAGDPPVGGGSACIEYFDLSDSHWYHSPHEIRMRGVTTTGQVSLCYEPWGGMQWSVGAISNTMAFEWRAVAATVAKNAGFNWTVGLDTYVPVMLSFPFGGAPRRLR